MGLKTCLWVLLGVVALAQTEPAAGQVGSAGALPPDLEETGRITFRVWSSHGDFQPSLDGAFLYFGENGPDGLVLKRASLLDGTVLVVAATPGKEAYRLAAIPGEPGQLVIAWQIGLGAASPYGVLILELSGPRERRLDIGGDGGDGRLHVSPSGKFLATGTAVTSSIPPVRGPWYPSEISVFSLATGKREFAYKISLHEERAMVPKPNSDRADEVAVRIPDTIRPGWTSDDVLVLGDGRDAAFRRNASGEWLRSEVNGKIVPAVGTLRQLVYPGELLRFRGLGVPPEALFGVRGTRFFACDLPDRGLAIREKVRDGWSTVEVVALKWRVEQPL